MPRSPVAGTVMPSAEYKATRDPTAAPLAGAGPVTCPTLAYRLAPATWRLKAIRADEVPPTKFRLTASAQTTLASPCRPTVTLKKSIRPRSPPVVHPIPMVQIAPKWLETSETCVVVKLGDALGFPFTIALRL